jgi:hypothetical protein
MMEKVQMNRSLLSCQRTASCGVFATPTRSPTGKSPGCKTGATAVFPSMPAKPPLPVFWSASGGQAFPADDFVQADAAESIRSFAP